MQTILTITAVVGIQALAWSLLYWRYRMQMISLRKEITQAGETLIAGPEIAFHQGSIGGIISMKMYGVLAMTDRRVIFRKPLGTDITIPLSSVAGLAESKVYRGNYRGGKVFLILTCTDGSQFAFIVKAHASWHSELASRIG